MPSSGSLPKPSLIGQQMVVEETTSQSSYGRLLIAAPILLVAASGCLFYYYYYYKNNDHDDQGKKKDQDILSKSSSTTTKVKLSAKIKPNQRKTSEQPHVHLKNEGNEFFRRKEYAKAIECYSQALIACNADHDAITAATLYQNRAAANEALGQVDDVIKDCSQAIELNKSYVKALVRRARAFESKEMLEEALADLTTACIVDSFANETNLMMTDRLLRKSSSVKAKDYLQVKQKRRVPPSDSFVRHYFASFCRHPCLKQPITSWQQLQDIIDDSLEDKEESVRLLMKGTQELLLGNLACASESFKKIIGPENKQSGDKKDIVVNALVKLGASPSSDDSDDDDPSSLLECQLKYFSQAVMIDESNADIYINRAQVLIMASRVEEARADLATCVKLEPSFVSAVAQKLYVDFRLAFQENNHEAVQVIFDDFARQCKRFPLSSEVHSLYAQALMESSRLEEADCFFVKAIACDSGDANLLVHRAILFLNCKNNTQKAESLLRQAVSVDQSCHFAHESLGTLLVQNGLLEEGIACFDRALNHGFVVSEEDACRLFSLRDAAAAQAKAASRLGVLLPGNA